jgi:ketosteroid isomerase-like protein
MSRKNVETLKRAVEAGRDRPDEFFAILDEDVVWDLGDHPAGKIYGHDGVRAFFRQWAGTFDDWQYEIRECIDAGSAVFVHMHQRGRGKTSGVPTEIDLWQVWLFFEGKVVRYVQKPDRRSALEAAGLAESATWERNVEIVRELYDAVRRRDAERVLTLYHPEVEADFSASPMGDLTGGDLHFHGHEGVRQINQHWTEAWAEVDYELGEMIGAGDHVVSAITYKGRGRESGVEVARTDYAVWTVQEGRIVRVVWLRTREEALAAAGIRE